MTIAELIADSFERIRQAVHGAIDGLGPEELSYRPDAEANSIAWLVWHLTRIQDDHVADVARTDQIWTTEGWAERFALPFDQSETGYGHSADRVGAVESDAESLGGYHDAVHRATIAYVKKLSDSDLDRIVDERWNPPVTLGVRLVSVIADDLQHAGQAAYVRGLLERR